MIHVFYPMSGARRNLAALALREGKNVRIGNCYLYQEGNDPSIRGVSIRGHETVVADDASDPSIDKAIDWVDAQHSGGVH